MNVLGDEVIFVCIHVEMSSFRVTILCFRNGSIRTRGNNVTYVGGKCKLFACNSNMDLNEFKLLICSKIGIDTTRNTINFCFKYNMSGQLLAFPVRNDDSIDAMWEHSKATYIPSLELYVEEVLLSNQIVNVTSNPSPTPMPILTQGTQNPFVPSPSSTPFEPSQTQVPNDATVNLGEKTKLVPWDDGNESNEFVDDLFEDDVDADVDEDALANDMTLGNIPTIITPTPYALCPPLDQYVEDNSRRTWACDTTYIEDGSLKRV